MTQSVPAHSQIWQRRFLKSSLFSSMTLVSTEIARLAGIPAVYKAKPKEQDRLEYDAELAALVAATRRKFKGADILINNAGTGSNETIMEAPDDKWQYYWDLHVMAAVRLSRGLIPAMRARGGGVILMNASICAFSGPLS